MSAMGNLFSLFGLEWGDWGVILFCTLLVLPVFAAFKATEKNYGTGVSLAGLLYAVVACGILYGLSMFLSWAASVFLRIAGLPPVGNWLTWFLFFVGFGFLIFHEFTDSPWKNIPKLPQEEPSQDSPKD